MTRDIINKTSIQSQFRQAARGVCRPLGIYDEMKKLTPPHVTSAPSVLACKPPSPNSQIVKRSDHLSDKKAKSSAQVESYVKRSAVLHNSCGLKPDRTRHIHLGIRLSLAERDILAGHAERNNLTISQYARLILLKNPSLDPQRHKLLFRANYELTCQGRNINQIAKQLNTNPASAGAAQELAEIRKTYLATSEAISHALVEGSAGSWLTD